MATLEQLIDVFNSPLDEIGLVSVQEIGKEGNEPPSFSSSKPVLRTLEAEIFCVYANIVVSTLMDTQKCYVKIKVTLVE